MLFLVSILAGVLILAGNTVWFWYVTSRPKPWARFTEAENAFWVKRGLPVQWAGACKRFEQGLGLRILVATGAIGGAILFVSALTLLLMHRHA